MDNQNDFKITIPKPCHEDWDTMKPNEKGAFCMKCAKTVVDFTQKTTGEINDFIAAQSGKKICGRFMSDQLENQAGNEKADDGKNKIWFRIPLHLLPRKLSFRNAFVYAVFITFGTTLFSCKTTSGEMVGEISATIDTMEIMGNMIPEQPRILGDTIIQLKKGEVKCEPKKDSIDPMEMMIGKVKIEK